MLRLSSRLFKSISTQPLQPLTHTQPQKLLRHPLPLSASTTCQHKNQFLPALNMTHHLVNLKKKKPTHDRSEKSTKGRWKREKLQRLLHNQRENFRQRLTTSLAEQHFKQLQETKEVGNSRKKCLNRLAMSILGSRSLPLTLSRPVLCSHCSCRVIPCEHPELGGQRSRAAHSLTMWSRLANESRGQRGLQSSFGRQSTEASWKGEGGGGRSLEKERR